MGLEALELGVVIRAIDYFSGPLQTLVGSAARAESSIKAITSSMRLMGASRSEINQTTAAMQRLNDQRAFSNMATDLERIGMARSQIQAIEQSYMRMSQYHRDITAAQGQYESGRTMVAAGTGNLMTGAIGAWGIFELVKKAGEFQSTMTVIQDTTGASKKQMDDFGTSVMNASAKVSRFNDMQMAGIAQTLTSGGFGNIKDVQGLLLPTAKYAEVQMYEKKSADPIEATKRAIEMAHTFGNYDPKKFEAFLNDFNKYSMMQPGDSSQLAQTLTYLAPTAQTMKMKQSDIMALAALDNVIGLTGSHGGTNSADMILRLIPGLVGGKPTKTRNPKAWKAMEDLGFIDSKGNSKFFDKEGKLTNLDAMLSAMITAGKTKNPKELMKAYHEIFGQQGGNAAAILANPRSLEQLAKMREQLGKTKSMEEMNTHLQATPEGQINLLKSNSMTLMLRVGQQLAISLNPALKSINAFLAKVLKFSEAHPQVAKLVGDFALLMVGGKLLEGMIKVVVGNFKMMGAAIRIFKLKNAAGELTGFGKVLKGIGTGVKTFGSWLGTAGKAIGRFGGTLGKLAGKGVVAALRGIGTAFKFLGSGALTVIKLIGRFGLTILRLGGQIAAFAIRAAASWLIAMGPVGWIIAGVTAIIALAILAWKTNFMGFRDKLTAIWKWIEDKAKVAWKNIVNWVKQAINFFKNLPAEMLQYGMNMMEMFAKGITGGISKVTSAVKGVANKIKGFLGFHSPTKEGPMSESDVFMPNMMKMFANGIDNNTHLIEKSSKKAAMAMKNSFAKNGVNGGGQKITMNDTNRPVQIIVNPHPNQRAEEIANIVMQKLGKSSRGMAMNTGSIVNMGAM